MTRSLIPAAGAAVLVFAVQHLACAPSSSTQAETDARIFAFTDVTVLPMTGPEVLAGHTVIVRDGVIERIGPTVDTAVPPDAVEIPGVGRFLLPGLADMHVHIDHPSDLVLYPAYGVTTVLNLRGLPSHLHWRREISAGERFGPTLYTTGDYMDGNPPDMPTMMSFDSPADAASAVIDQKNAGYDFIKVYAALSEEQFLAITATARREGIGVVGHTSDNYSLETLLRAGQANIAHADQLGRYLDDDSPANVRNVVERIAASKATVTPNLGLHRALLRMWEDLDPLLERLEARTLHPAVFQPFRRPNNRYVRRGKDWYENLKNRRLPLLERLTRDLHQAGVPLLLGTDSPVAGSYPGQAVWEDLHALAVAGLDPYSALVTATSNPGRFIARHLDPEVRFGQIRAGYRADLVLLDRNPFENLGHIETQSGVMLRGEWHPRPELRERLERTADGYASWRESVEIFEQHVYAGEIERAREVFRGVRGTRPEEVLFSQYPVFFVGLGYLYGEDGFHSDPRRREIALELYEMYAETYPEFHSSHYMLGQAYLANGNTAAAKASFRRVLEIHPYSPSARQALTALSP